MIGTLTSNSNILILIYLCNPMPFFDIENYLNYQRFTQLISKYIRIRKLEIMESVHGFFVNNVRKLKKQYEFGLLLFKGTESIS